MRLLYSVYYIFDQVSRELFIMYLNNITSSRISNISVKKKFLILISKTNVFS